MHSYTPRSKATARLATRCAPQTPPQASKQACVRKQAAGPQTLVGSLNASFEFPHQEDMTGGSRSTVRREGKPD